MTELLAKLERVAEGATLHGTMSFTFKEEKKTVLSGSPAKWYVPQVDEAHIKSLDNGKLCALEFSPEDLIKISEGLQELSRYERRDCQIPYTCEVVIEPSAAPPQPEAFSVPLDVFMRACRLEEEAVDLLFEVTPRELEEAQDRNRYECFKLHEFFHQHPCSFEFFQGLLHELLSTRPGLGIKGYYCWFVRSRALLSEGGQLLPETIERAEGLLSIWKDVEADTQKQRLLKSLAVHPRHWKIFCRFVEEKQKAPSS